MSLDLQTERLTMRPWAEADVDGYRALVAERGHGTPTVDDIRARMAKQWRTAEETGFALLTVRRRPHDEFIGYCGLTVGRCSVEEPEIAYELFRRARGRGFATEAARAVVDAAAATGRARLWSTGGSWNAASLRVLEKLEFEIDHVADEGDRGQIVWLTRALP